MKKLLSLFSVLLVLVLSACGTEKNVEIPIDEVMTKIKSEVSLPDEMMDLSSADQLKSYYGIDSAKVKGFAVSVNSSGVEQDEIVIIQASDSNSVKDIEEALKNRLSSKENQMKNYLPEQYEIIKSCSVKTYGNYVTLFISKDADKMDKIISTYLK